MGGTRRGEILGKARWQAPRREKIVAGISKRKEISFGHGFRRSGARHNPRLVLGKSGTCSILNRQIADFAARHPDRISAFASINPSFPKESIAEIKRAKNLGFIGVGELHDGVQGFDFLSGQFTEIAELCAECGFPICVHLTEKSPRKYLGKCPTNFESAYAAARKCPSAKFIFAHLSGGDAAIDGFSPPTMFFSTQRHFRLQTRPPTSPVRFPQIMAAPYTAPTIRYACTRANLRARRCAQ